MHFQDYGYKVFEAKTFRLRDARLINMAFYFQVFVRVALFLSCTILGTQI